MKKGKRKNTIYSKNLHQSYLVMQTAKHSKGYNEHDKEPSEVLGLLACLQHCAFLNNANFQSFQVPKSRIIYTNFYLFNSYLRYNVPIALARGRAEVGPVPQQTLAAPCCGEPDAFPTLH